VDSSGNLTDLTPDSPYITATNPISVLAVNTFLTGESTNGVFVYVGSQANESGSLSVFQVCTVENAICNTVNLNELVPVGSSVSLGQNPVAMLVDPTNSFLYVTCYVSNQIYGYRINPTAGTLTAQSPAYQPTGSGPVSMAMHPSISDTGQFIYTSNTASSNITGFAVSTTTGSMSNPITVIAPAAPSGMASD
jgi:6-phosphogluconolactonase (cycloisomerase 2 family)